MFKRTHIYTSVLLRVRRLLGRRWGLGREAGGLFDNLYLSMEAMGDEYSFSNVVVRIGMAVGVVLGGLGRWWVIMLDRRAILATG